MDALSAKVGHKSHRRAQIALNFWKLNTPSLSNPPFPNTQTAAFAPCVHVTHLDHTVVYGWEEQQASRSTRLK